MKALALVAPKVYELILASIYLGGSLMLTEYNDDILKTPDERLIHKDKFKLGPTGLLQAVTR